VKWAQSLIRISNHHVEELQKRLGEIAGRRADAEMRLTLLHAEAASEKVDAAQDVEAGWYQIGFLQGWRWRRDELHKLIAQITQEEAGARDALTSAFEELKKFEQVAETARLAAVKEANRKEIAEMDELGQRRRAAS
jgi:flagellar FliJ protein